MTQKDLDFSLTQFWFKMKIYQMQLAAIAVRLLFEVDFFRKFRSEWNCQKHFTVPGQISCVKDGKPAHETLQSKQDSWFV